MKPLYSALLALSFSVTLPVASFGEASAERKRRDYSQDRIVNFTKYVEEADTKLSELDRTRANGCIVHHNISTGPAIRNLQQKIGRLKENLPNDVALALMNLQSVKFVKSEGASWQLTLEEKIAEVRKVRAQLERYREGLKNDMKEYVNRTRHVATTRKKGCELTGDRLREPLNSLMEADKWMETMQADFEGYQRHFESITQEQDSGSIPGTNGRSKNRGSNSSISGESDNERSVGAQSAQ